MSTDKADMAAEEPRPPEWRVRQQIVRDEAVGLTVHLEVRGTDYTPYALRIYHEALPGGNRTLLFGPDGVNNAADTDMMSPCRPTWLKARSAWSSAKSSPSELNSLEKKLDALGGGP